MNEPKQIIILCGIPCSGKSTFAKQQYNFTTDIVSRDTIREKLAGKFYKFSSRFEDLVTNNFNFTLKTLINDLTTEVIILDNTHCKEKYINEIIKKYSEHNIKIKFFDISLWKAHHRNIIRYFKTGKWIPIKVINQMYKNYNKINKQKYEKYLVHQ